MDFIYLYPSIVFLFTILYTFLSTCTTKKKDGKRNMYKGISRTPSVFAKDRKNKAKPEIEVLSLREEKMNSSSISKRTKEKDRKSNVVSSKEKNDNNLERKSNNSKNQPFQPKNMSIKNPTVHTFKNNNYDLQMTQKQPVGIAVDPNQMIQAKEAVEIPKNVIDPVKTVGDLEDESPNDKNKQIEDPIKTIMNEPDLQKCTQVDDEINTVVPGKLCETQPYDLPNKDELKNGVPPPKQIGSQKNNDGKSEVGSLINDSKAMNDQYETLNNIEFAIPLPIPPPIPPQDNKSIKDVNVEVKMTNDKTDAEKNDDKKKAVEKKDVVINKKEERISNGMLKSDENKKELNKTQEKKSVTPKVENKDKKLIRDEKNKGSPNK
uniref:Uncharacterized protein n=1 Tax=Strongyloides papillosus TaxID=174720 RepID=A0A0N5CIF9_STREA